jgi:hypothetical protein
VFGARERLRTADASTHLDGAAHRRWRPAAPDVVAIVLYLAIPAAIYVPLSAAGHPLMYGDALYQNYPLRVLAGRFLAAGQLPRWDPFLWSGTPLLAGWNAGAMFPGTWLFAVMPGVAAWTLNLVLTSALAAIGTYAFLRRLACGTLASFLGGLVFSYTGFMSGQQAHLGLVEGTAMLPWLLFALESLARRRPGAPARGWVVLAGIASALTVLAGDPRAISTSAIAIVIDLLAWLARDPPLFARRILPGALGGAVLGGLLSAVQWLPGVSFIRASQRGVSASSLFSAGSISLAHIGALLLVPFLLGGSTNFGLVVYQGVDSIQELTIGVGLVALAAALAYLPELARSLRDWLARTARLLRRGTSGEASGEPVAQPPRRRLAVWYVMALCGTLLSEGSDTRLGGVLAKIPLYGGERLQNRNAELIDVALVVLLAFFVDDVTGWTRGELRGWRPLGSWTSTLLATLAPLAALLLILAAFADPLGVERMLAVPVPDHPALFEQLAPYLIATALLAVALIAYLVVAARLGARARRRLLVAFVLADVLTYALNASYAAPAVAHYGAGTPAARAVAALTGPEGRFAIFDPLFSFPVTGMAEPNSLGLPDLNILQGTGSVEGYGSIVNGNYQNATDTHGVEYLAQGELSGPAFDTLDLTALLTLPVYIWGAVPRSTALPVAGQGAGVNVPTAPPDATGPYTLQPGQSETFVMASASPLLRASAILDTGPKGTPTTLRIAEGDRVGTSTPAVAVSNGTAVAGFGAARVDSVVVENSSTVPAVIGAVTVVTRHPARRYVLDGMLQGDLAPPHWRLAGPVDTPYGDNFVAFVNTQTAGEAWLQPDGSSSPQPANRLRSGSVVVRAEPVTSPETMVVDTPSPAELVRSTGFASGWSATITPLAGGRSDQEIAQPFGLVQMVHVPAGRFLVTWHYSSRSTRYGELLSLCGLVALLAIAAIASAGAWRRRRSTATAAAEAASHEEGQGGSPEE